MANFKTLLFTINFLILICACSAPKSVLEEVGKDRVMQEMDCFIKHIQKERSDTFFSISSYRYKGKSYLYIKTEDAYSDTLVNAFHIFTHKNVRSNLPLTKLKGCLIRDNIFICFYGDLEFDGLIKKEEIPLEYKNLYINYPVYDVGGYVLDALYSARNGKLKIEAIGAIGGAFDIYLEEREKLCKLPSIKLSRELRKI